MGTLGASDFEQAFVHLNNLGLTSDILPVVWNKDVSISSRSGLKSIGKVPSVINSAGFVTGISAWTKKQTSSADVQAWASNPCYGVALQTRLIRGLDIDIDNPELAQAVAHVFEKALGFRLPRRGRPNSGKMLLAFELEGHLKKRVMRCSGGIIELLGTGQQFIFDSIHVSGKRYAWEGGLPAAFPKVSQLDLERAWRAVEKEFAIKKSPPVLLAPAQSGDARGKWLLEHWPNHGYGSNGQLHIECPFKAGHSSDGAVSECSYLAAGTNGYQEGRYHCFHASCGERSQAEFDRATGFDRVVQTGATALWPASIKLNDDGSVPAKLVNLVCVLNDPDLAGGQLMLDEFLGEVIFKPTDNRSTCLFDDDMRAELRFHLETLGFRRIIKDDLREAVRLVARQNRCDSAQEWLQSLQWDGRPRIEQFLKLYMGAEDTDYTRAISQYLWSALAARVIQPGCQADMVPIFVSPEGRHKSTALQAIAPSPEQFVEIDLHNRDADLSRMMKSKLIGEIAELRGLQQRQVEGIKAFVTRRWEEWTPKYVEKPVRYERRIVFVGTTNDPEFLGRGTGQRRWLPCQVGNADPEMIRQDRDQLWAEAACVVWGRLDEGHDPVMWEQAYDLAIEQREAFMIEDLYETKIREWLATEDGRKLAATGVTTEFLLCMVLSAAGRSSPLEQSRVVYALRSCGFQQERRWVGGSKQRIWVLAE